MDLYYTPDLKDKLKLQFKGIDRIETNYSHINQDMFVLSILDGKLNGTYLEIGSNYPSLKNNTYLLEKEFDWRGVGIELGEQYIDSYRSERSNPVYMADALTVDYDELLRSNKIEFVVDYLSCDIEPPANTFAALKKIPHHKMRFRVITFEHDAYTGSEGESVRDDSRKFLSDLGYELVVSDVNYSGWSVEDWWIYPNLVSQERVAVLKDISSTLSNHDQIIYKKG